MMSNPNIKLLLKVAEACLNSRQPKLELFYSMELENEERLKGAISIDSESNGEFTKLKEQLALLNFEIKKIYLCINEEIGDKPNYFKNYYFGEIREGEIISTSLDMEDNHTAFGRVPLPKNERYLDILEVLKKIGIGVSNQL